MAENKEQAQANEEIKAEEADVVEEAEQEIITDEETAVNDDEIAALQKEKDDLYDRLLRLQAEYDNFKRRTQKEKEAERKYKAQDIVNDLLPVLDNFERALQVEQTEATSNLIEGISMVYRQLQDVLTNNGVEVIETEGKEFDPNLHHAVMQVEDEAHESNHIVEELQKGYMLKDRVIRPSMVKVNK
ncbi:nucleotide exchange factor GrpE [Oceanobacillus indicireducens]|uniref:Protein GrpE n=1 Tax=Oceanobacillus indicireducens TaxID=1004261 RepID=A0A918D074_9BACI|nr:nucleotide exchange factor GrpE [Oceanobacillus indicireducens]GGN54671.1 protein GrpE [Oceanobacillus indicireducens]